MDRRPGEGRHPAGAGHDRDQPDRPQVPAEERYSHHGIELDVDQCTGRVVYAQVAPKRTLRAPGAKKGRRGPAGQP